MTSQHVLAELPPDSYEPRGIRSVLVFLLHQLVAAYGTAVLAASAGYSLFEFLGLFSKKISMRPMQWILTETPYFPVQIALGLYLGWVLGRRFRHWYARWVWVLPFLILACAVVRKTVGIPEWSSIFMRPGFGQSRLSYYFGWGCNPTVHCLDQLALTLPFYSSVAYSVGAWFARRSQTRRMAGGQ